MVARSTSPHALHWSLDPDVVFLNHGSFGATPTAVLAEQQRWRDRMEADPVAFLDGEGLEGMHAARRVLAGMLGCDADDLALIDNATSGVNTVLRSMRLSPGDEILVPDHAYQACRNAIDVVADRWGATVVTVPLPFPIDGPEVILERMLADVTDRTVLAMVDAITSPTGLRMPFEDLVAALEGRGVAVLLDAAHGIGAVPLNLDAIGASWTTTNAHKWLCAPKGSAVLHVRKDRQEGLHPLTVSHGLTLPLEDGQSRFRAEFDWTGTRDLTAWCALPFTVEHVGGMVDGGWPAVMARNRALALEARAMLCERLDLEVPCPDSMIATLATLRLPLPPAGKQPGKDPLHLWLRERKVQIPVWSWPSPAGRYVRLSAHLHNSMEQYEHLADLLEEAMLAFG